MKIIIVCEFYFPHLGGVEVVFDQLAKNLVALGHEIHIITSKLENTLEYELIDGIHIHRVRVFHKGDRYWFAFFAIPRIIKIAKTADIIHTTTYTAALPAWIAAKLLRKKCVITVHEVWGSLWNTMTTMSRLSIIFHRISEILLVSLPFDRYCCVSNSTRNCLLKFGIGINNNKCLTIYNGIDYKLFNPHNANGKYVRERLKVKNDFLYLYYGRPGISKGLKYLIMAVPSISKSIPNSRLVLILSKDPLEEYKKILALIKELHIQKVVLLDPVPRKELPNYIAAANCVVVPSRSEGFGFSAAEACAMGKPIVASNVASLPEVVSGEFVLVEPCNSNAIVEGILKIYNNETQHTPNKVFLWDKCIDEYIQIYQKLLV